MLMLDEPGVRREYTLMDDRDSPEPTVFEIRRLTSEELQRVFSLSPLPLSALMRIAALRAVAQSEDRDLTEEENAEIAAMQPDTPEHFIKTTTQMRLAASLGITRVGSLMDRDTGKPMTVTPAQFLAGCRNLQWIRELGAQVMEFSTLDETDRKN